jgi:hypothetical protein
MATKIPKFNLAKWMATIIEREQLEISERGPKQGVKAVTVGFTGIGVINRFKNVCH